MMVVVDLVVAAGVAEAVVEAAVAMVTKVTLRTQSTKIVSVASSCGLRY